MLEIIQNTPAQGDADAEWFTPDVGDNLVDPEPFRLQLRPMTAGEIQRIEAKGAKVTGRSINYIERAQQQQQAMFTAAVLRVEGFAIRDPVTQQVTRPATGAELLKCLQGATGEIYKAVIDQTIERIQEGSRMSEDAKKKPDLRSVGT
jgi:hypothetical protein